MRKSIQGFFSRFRRKINPDPTALRTMAESQLDDLQGQNKVSREEKAFNEKFFKKSQKENPIRR